MTERTHKAVTIILCMLAGIALGIAFSGFEIPMAWPGGTVKDSFTVHPDKPEGGWTLENMKDWNRGVPDDPDSLQEQVDRMQFEIDTFKGRLQEIPALKLRIMDLELRQMEFEKAFRHLLGGS